jgi:folylpolyglutamate synthase/dihydropteroate synthase
VNACALKDMPYWLERDFHIPPTVQQEQQLPETTQEMVRRAHKVWVKMRRNGKVMRKRMTRYRWVTVTKTVMVTQTVTVANPVFDNLMAAATAFRAAQPAPYNSGDCT